MQLSTLKFSASLFSKVQSNFALKCNHLPLLSSFLHKQWIPRSTYSTEPSPVLVEINDQVQWIRLHRPKAYNAMNFQAYRAVMSALHSAAENDLVKMTVVTGTGPYFSSGKDLSKFDKKNNFGFFSTLIFLLCLDSNKDLSDQLGNASPSEAAAAGHNIVQEFINAFIDYPKPIVAAVNGPAYGIMVTTLAFYDAIIASETASFTTPFSKLAISPEGCSSWTFLQMLGPTVASQMLLFSQTLSAERAFQLGFVSELVKKETDFEAFVTDWLHNPKRGVLPTCDYTSMLEAKALMRDEQERLRLKEINRKEFEVLDRMYARGEVFRIAEKLLKAKRSR